MPNKFDVAIIGASLAGASAAYTLGNAGLSVALIDARTFRKSAKITTPKILGL
jgi:flavin-dependent dehydrogenase